MRAPLAFSAPSTSPGGPGREPMNEPIAERRPIALRSAAPTFVVDDVGAASR
jgi:hypothetical protein